MLMNSTNSVGKIAITRGFPDVYSFSHLFRRVTGYSPSDWRKKEVDKSDGTPENRARSMTPDDGQLQG